MAPDDADSPDTDSTGVDGPDGDSTAIAAEKRRRRAEVRQRAEPGEPDHAGFCRSLHRFLADAVSPDVRVVVYQAFGTEVDLTGLVVADDDPGRRFAVTRTPDEGLVLSVHAWGGPQERHPYGYDQPLAGSPEIADGDIGAVLVPALAFDDTGVRLGRGKGYYDRFLARLDPSCLRIGITGDQLVEQLPVGPHDVSMTHLAFSDRVIAVGPDG